MERAGGFEPPTTSLGSRAADVGSDASKPAPLDDLASESDAPTSPGVRSSLRVEPNETNPQYRSMLINGLRAIPGRTDESTGRCTRQIEALVKLEYIPATHDRDFLIIDDFEALALAIQSIKFAEANDPENSQKYLQLAIAELNFESRNKNPAEQFVTQVNVMGSRRTITNPI